MAIDKEVEGGTGRDERLDGVVDGGSSTRTSKIEIEEGELGVVEGDIVGKIGIDQVQTERGGHHQVEIKYICE